MAITGANYDPEWEIHYGDGTTVPDGASRTGGPSVISGDVTVPFRLVSGDYFAVSGPLSRLVGGDDIIRVSAAQVFGDAERATLSPFEPFSRAGEVIGGNDLIEMRPNKVDFAVYLVTGDVRLLTSRLVGGDDTIVGARDEALLGTFYGDTGEIGFRSVFAGGDDRITGTDRGDVIYGDFTTAAYGAEVTAGDDRLFGLKGNDTIYGDGDEVAVDNSTAGRDVIRGGDGRDRIFGDVRAVVDTGNGRINARDGDTALGGRDKLWGGRGDDRIWGGGGRDRIWGENGDDTLRGGYGGDTIRPGRGDDRVFGERGDDRIVITDGSDVVTGGRGADVFVFRDGGGWTTRITDFRPDRGDRIDLSDIAAVTGWADLAGMMSNTAQGMVIAFGAGGNEIRLDGVKVADLGVEDFIF